MDVRHVMQERRTVHRYRKEPLPEGAVDRALAVAVLAPNHKLTFPWRFTRVGENARERIADLAVELKRAGGPLDEAQIAPIRGKVLDPAELIVVSLVRCEDPVVAREDYASAACAIQNLSLSLWSEGVGSKWSSGKLTTHPRTYALCGIDPEREEIVGFVWAGIPDKIPAVAARPSLDELVRHVD
jgi:nitroreductase